MKFKPTPCFRLAAAATLLGLAAGAQAAIVIALTPTQAMDGSWDTKVDVSGSVAANAAMSLDSPNFDAFGGTWTALTLADNYQLGLLHGNGYSPNFKYDLYTLAAGGSSVNSLGAPGGLEIAGAPGGAFGAFANLAGNTKFLFLNAGYVLGTAVSYAYTADSDIRSWAVDGAYASLKDANGLELFRIEVDTDGVLGTASTPAIPAVTAVPEPGTYALMALGLAGVGFARRRRG